MFTIESKNPPIFREKTFDDAPYLFERIIVPIADENTGSEIEASANSSFETGSAINVGSLSSDFASSTNQVIFTQPQTQTAHSGSIPSFQTVFSSLLT
ncbi:hypothetical protein, partial [Pseudoalteromonas fuliginea]|uniref:hypothetical protein n=1 Tax=Pseudoalteromonas fuliginea TaxID=1872678 RepID=UPI000519BEB5